MSAQNIPDRAQHTTKALSKEEQGMLMEPIGNQYYYDQSCSESQLKHIASQG